MTRHWKVLGRAGEDPREPQRRARPVANELSALLRRVEAGLASRPPPAARLRSAWGERRCIIEVRMPVPSLKAGSGLWIAPRCCWRLCPLWLIGALGRGLWTPDEPRVADIAWRMSGERHWVVPHLAGRAVLESPPLSYWAAALSIRAFGDSGGAPAQRALCGHSRAGHGRARIRTRWCPDSDWPHRRQRDHGLPSVDVARAAAGAVTHGFTTLGAKARVLALLPGHATCSFTPLLRPLGLRRAPGDGSPPNFSSPRARGSCTGMIWRRVAATRCSARRPAGRAAVSRPTREGPSEHDAF